MKNDSGFTLTELLIAVLVTGILTISIGAVVSYASNSLWRSVDNATATQSALRAVRLLRADFSSAKSVLAYPAAAPVFSTISLDACTSSARNGTFVNWPTDTTWDKQAPLVRPLFTLDVVDLPYDKDADSLGWIQSKRLLVTYEIRRSATSKPFELWRVTCGSATDASGVLVLSSQEQVVSLGSARKFPDKTTSGVSNLQCAKIDQTLGTLTLSSCQPISSGANLADFYSFTFPYPGDPQSRVLRDLVGPMVKNLKTRVEVTL